MRYPRELHERAGRELNSRRRSALDEQERRVSHMQNNHPDIWQFRSQAAMLGAKMGMALMVGNQEQHSSLRGEMEEYNSRLRESLTAAGFPADYLEVQYTCGSCEDRGVIGIEGRPCECKKAILNRLVYEMLSNISLVDDCSFNTFDLDYYSGGNRKSMSKLLEACRRYASEFCSTSPNLLFMGQTGLGKTHLSLSIAREVVNKGKMVVYASAGQLIDRLVDIRFNPESQDEYKNIVYECDLLVLDDLGTEFPTKFTKSEVYSIINTRCIERVPTIINTNLSFADMEALYDQRVVSRLAGEYVTNQFTGKDIRIEKRKNLTVPK